LTERNRLRVSSLPAAEASNLSLKSGDDLEPNSLQVDHELGRDTNAEQSTRLSRIKVQKVVRQRFDSAYVGASGADKLQVPRTAPPFARWLPIAGILFEPHLPFHMIQGEQLVVGVQIPNDSNQDSDRIDPDQKRIGIIRHGLDWIRQIAYF
jgi:hypothetical protein